MPKPNPKKRYVVFCTGMWREIPEPSLFLVPQSILEPTSRVLPAPWNLAEYRLKRSVPIL